MNNDDTTNKRFSLVYLTSDKGLPDSKRARVRIKSLLNFTSLTNQSLAAAIQRELGVEVPPAVRGFQIGRFIETCELRDFLDFISVVTNMMNSADRVGWLRECRQVFSDEHLRYTINDAGGVRFSADAQFEQSVQATLANLERPFWSKTGS